MSPRAARLCPARGGFASWAFLRCRASGSSRSSRGIPGLKVQNRIVRAREYRFLPGTLAPRPVGYRVEVIDYDASNDGLPVSSHAAAAEQRRRPDSASYTDTRSSSRTRCSIDTMRMPWLMRTLARASELALGRRIGYAGLQRAPVEGRAPCVFGCEECRFYSERDLTPSSCGYFPATRNARSTRCLSHDVVVLPDRPRPAWTASARATRGPSSPDQAAFHERLRRRRGAPLRVRVADNRSSS